jgi:hypothetical protein
MKVSPVPPHPYPLPRGEGAAKPGCPNRQPLQFATILQLLPFHGPQDALSEPKPLVQDITRTGTSAFFAPLRSIPCYAESQTQPPLARWSTRQSQASRTSRFNAETRRTQRKVIPQRLDCATGTRYRRLTQILVQANKQPLRFTPRLTTVLPLPKGEGRGEGEGDVRKVTISNTPIRSAQGAFL